MKKEKNCLTPIDASTRYEGGRVPSLTINGFGCFKEAFEYKITTSEDSYLLIFCDFGEGFYLHNGKNGVIRQGQYMIVKESDGFACSIYLPAECMMIHVLSFYYRVPYTITTKTPEIILTDINSRVYGGWNIFMRACNILSNENAVDNLPYASALLLSFIEAERYVKNEGVDAGSAKSEL